MHRRSRWVLLGLVLGVTSAAAGPAFAHPLGNFSISHHNTLVVGVDGLDLRAVVDVAELPTRQQQDEIDTDADGALSEAELADRARAQCATLVDGFTTTVDGDRVAWSLDATKLEVVPGDAQLPTLRLTCDLSADASVAGTATVLFADDNTFGRSGWREVVATGDGVRLVESDVPRTSSTDELREYPEDMPDGPLDVTTASLVVEPGGESGDAVVADAGDLQERGDAFGRLLAAGDRLLQGTVGRDNLTPLVGIVAVLLAMLLGAGHAVLPGHGKTVMAAYLAGRRGTRADALVVGATVTLTHTAGVLLLGLVLSIGSAVAGEVVLQRLGLLSGVLIALVGLSLLRDALRSRRRVAASRALVGAGTSVTIDGHGHGHGHGHDHGHGHGHGHDHGHGHGHDHGHGHAHDVDTRFSRRGLVGMAMAGGLVPSPSALVVLLASVALGRTVFGVGLVMAYGLGMAGTLVAVGLLLVRLRRRFDDAEGQGRGGRLFARLQEWLPMGTATLVVVVGLGLVVRSLLVG